MRQGGRWRAVGIVLALGAVYDLVFAIAILGFTRAAASMLGLPVPGDPVYLYLNGVFLVFLAGIYAAVAREPERYGALVPIFAGGRALGFLLFVWAWTAGRPAIFLVLGLTDLAFAAANVVLWRRAIRISD